MHISPITIGVTALFILARLSAATSSDHVDVAIAPFPNPGQPKPGHLRFVPHHRHQGGDNGFAPHRHRFTDDRYSSKDKRSGPGQVPSLTSSNNFINFCMTAHNQPITHGQQIKGGSCNPVPMGTIPSHKHKRGWSGSGYQAAAKKNAEIQALRSKLRQLEAPRPSPTTYRSAENRNKAIFGRAPTSYKVDFNAMRQAEQRNSDIQNRINNLRKEQKMINHGIPDRGRRVAQQYTRPDTFSPGMMSAFGV